MAKIDPLTNPSSYSESAVESILGIQTDGPIAQDIKVKKWQLMMGRVLSARVLRSSPNSHSYLVRILAGGRI